MEASFLGTDKRSAEAEAINSSHFLQVEQRERFALSNSMKRRKPANRETAAEANGTGLSSSDKSISTKASERELRNWISQRIQSISSIFCSNALL